MRFIEKYILGKPVYKNVSWTEHCVECSKCMTVNLSKTSTFVNACAVGSQLLSEECRKIQAPIEKEKKEKVRKWAEAAGVFKL